MSSTTTNLSLFKYDTVADAKSKFNIDTALNDNFDKIDTFAGNVNANKANIDLSNLSQTGQGVLNAKQNASTAVKHTANTAVGSASQPVYIDANGNAVAGNSIPNTTSSVTSGSSDALTSGGAYTNLVKRYSTSSATGGTNTPVYVDSTGKVQSCGSSIESTRFDGQWVSSVSTLSTATAVGTYTIDLSSYLPNDNYNYEVYLTTTFRAGASDTYTTATKITISGGGIISGEVIIGLVQSYGVYNINGFYYPVSDRSITLKISRHNAFGHDTIVYGYRRIGTNG